MRGMVGRAAIVGEQVVGRWVAGAPCERIEPRTDLEAHLAALAGRLEAQARFMEKNALHFGSACSPLVFDPSLRPCPPPSWRGRLLRATHLNRVASRLRAMVRGNGR